jgi:dipeptidase D
MFEAPRVPAPAGQTVKITLSGLPGGHSGACIHEKRGNALTMLARIAGSADCAVAAFSGGTVDNAIPGCAEIVAVLADAGRAEPLLRTAAEACRKELDPAFTLKLDITPCPAPDRVWEKEFRMHFLQLLGSAPHGVAEFSEAYGVPLTSGNIASLRTEENRLRLVFSTRSLEDARRKAHTRRIIDHFAPLAPETAVTSEYPGWTPDAKSSLPETAVRLRRELTGRETRIEVIHAGLEAGIFAGKNPRLRMMSCGPDMFDIHTPLERVSIAAVGEFYTFMKALVRRLTDQ